ncbi:MAG: (d)CMP kinase [Oscillospiraceae bacterium]
MKLPFRPAPVAAASSVDGGRRAARLAERADISSELRTPAVSTAASRVSALPVVRQFLLEQQRVVARTHDVIMDGRDIGTVVLPDADVKIFLSASPEVRARRRWLELQEKGTPDTYEAVLADLIARDELDSNRAIAPLRPADDAVLLDTSGMTLQESIDAILKLIRKKVTV